MSTLGSMKIASRRLLSPMTNTVRKRSPEILMGVGVAGIATSGVLLVRQTLKVQPILEKHRSDLEGARNTLITPSFSEKDHRKNIAKVYAGTSLKLIVHYAPAVIVGIGGLAAVLVSNGILKQRNLAIMGAYQALHTTLGEYRKRVARFVGEQEELSIYRGIQEIETIDEETGEITKSQSTDPNSFSIYTKFFDELSPYWSKTSEFNLLFLRNKQSYFNDMLHAKGYVFLSDVYDELGIPVTQASRLVGWEVNRDGDNYIDFGIYDFHSDDARAFVNGQERSIRLDFNVDGIILQSLPEA